ncbi:hypothetical protein KL930_001225 [Ogataea haglerorum]|uniref:Amino acid transporter transmembrane domain-containing protein n=1 Tax=Ogataea haglerorum TaxID=1937702 RepID=A0AAN6HZQ2_9ASCO|nr:hypothetical protein KL915_003135 [Ogataea haglerorum]KAG7706227.1 hypothetical protein KL914_003122 [Ogataea haglerorum]KAG7708060.1 hypothetical protein KL950_002686 [Ogataea haglerorum]KAG7717142.1 hypothetical protein KL913_002893 [Ogataea haglerorum]KAG7719470.1 hypothetical protein KL949_002462 [Ogataea haglerorum]
MGESPTKKNSGPVPIVRRDSDARIASRNNSRRTSMARLAASPLVSGTPLSVLNQKRPDSPSSSVIDDRASPVNAHRNPSAQVYPSLSTSGSSDAEDTSILGRGEPQVDVPLSSSHSSAIDDPTLWKNVSKHLATDANGSLKLAGGDITRDLYTLPAKKNNLRRSRSLTGADLPGERRGSAASQIRLPGGFRRQFILHKNSKYGHQLSKPTFFTRNFLEFLSIYGHFAGEDLEDEDYLACSYVIDKDTDEETPLLEPRAHGGTASTLKSFFLLLKSFVGTGVLFLPRAFYNGGILFCTLTLLFFGALSYWCYYILVLTKVKTRVSSFGDIGMILYGRNMKLLILSSIILSQIGFVAAYTIFTAENLRAFVLNFFGVDISLGNWVVMECVVFIPLSLIRNITKLSLAALLANIFILSGLVTIVYYASLDLIENGPAHVELFNQDKWSLFIGVAIFAFEGIGLIIPVQESMKHPEQYPKVLGAVIIVCSILFIGVGSLGYMTYGDQVNTVVILNLPQSSIAVRSIQLFYAIAILLSAPLQLLPAIRIIESRLYKRRSGKTDSATKWSKNMFRTCMVVGTSLIAYLGSSNLDQFVSFVGSFACIPLVYMYPPMLHYKICAHTRLMKIIDMSLVVLGGVAMVYTSYQVIVG